MYIIARVVSLSVVNELVTEFFKFDVKEKGRISFRQFDVLFSLDSRDHASHATTIDVSPLRYDQGIEVQSNGDKKEL